MNPHRLWAVCRVLGHRPKMIGQTFYAFCDRCGDPFNVRLSTASASMQRDGAARDDVEGDRTGPKMGRTTE